MVRKWKETVFMKLKFKIAIALLAATTLAVGGVVVKYDVVTKVRYIGNSPTEAVSNLLQILRKDGLLNTLRTVRNKLGNDPRLGLGYSLYDKASYPPLESSAERDALPEFKIIPGVDVATLPPSRATDLRHDTWHRSHGGDFSAKYSAFDQIDRNNVGELVVAWTYTSGPYRLDDAMKSGSPVQTNPVVADGRLFVPSIDSHLLSIDGASGREIWRVKMPPPVARRGMVWEPNADFSQSRLFVPTGRGVYAVNAASGEILSGFGNNGQVGDQLSLIAPVIAGEKLIIGLIKPALEAYDLRTGKRLWTRPLLETPEAINALLTGGVPCMCPPAILVQNCGEQPGRARTSIHPVWSRSMLTPAKSYGRSRKSRMTCGIWTLRARRF
jgi:hypothetical protein